MILLALSLAGGVFFALFFALFFVLFFVPVVYSYYADGLMCLRIECNENPEQ